MKNEFRNLKVGIVNVKIKYFLLCFDVVIKSFICVYFLFQCGIVIVVERNLVFNICVC